MKFSRREFLVDSLAATAAGAVGGCAMRGNAELKNVPMASKAGKFVKIKSGPMAGLEGYVVNRGGKLCVVVNVEALGAAIEVAVSPEYIAES